MRNVAITCIEESCSKKGVSFFNGTHLCPSCGNEMFPVEEVKADKERELNDESTDFSGDMFERMSGQAFMDAPRLRPIVVKHSDTFQCSPDLTGCPIAKPAKVSVPIEMFNRWIFLAQQFDTEWIAYLKGNAVEGQQNEYEITEMYFPKQKASGAHVSAEDGEIQDGTIAAVHSHVGMQVFFSKEDEEHFNHTIEFVINNRGDIKAIGRTKLECGRYHRGDVDVSFSNCGEELALEEQLKSKLTEEKVLWVKSSKQDKQKQTYLSYPKEYTEVV